MKRILPLALMAVGCIDPEANRDINEFIESGEQVPDWLLPEAATNDAIAPSDYAGRASAYFFCHATGDYCSSQFGYLDQMLSQIDATTRTGIGIVGINQIGYDSGNAFITQDRTAPWVQDNEAVNVWSKWGVSYRDVLILDGERHAIHVTNLSDAGLQNQDNFCDLASILYAVDDGASAQGINDGVLAGDYDGNCPSGLLWEAEP